jgi:hypothetical protein
VTGTQKWGRWRFVASPGVRPGGYRLIPDYKDYSEPKYENVLPDDQKNIVEMVKEIASRYGFDVEIVDVTKSEKGPRIKTFPALITDSGEKIEGSISKEQIESFFAKAT